MSFRARHRTGAVFLAVLAALSSRSAQALDRATILSQYGHDVWDSDSGLPQNTVDAIVETRDGYLWLGTQEGLVRFDGVRFTIFDTRNSKVMGDDWVRALCQAGDGTLWAGTSTGLLRLKDGRFEDSQPGGPLATAIVFCLFEDRQGSLWVGSSAGLARVQGSEIRFFAEKEGVADSRVSSIGEDSDGAVWIGTGTGAARFDGEKFHALSAPEDLPGVALAFQPEPAGGIWIGTPRGLVRRVNGRNELYGPSEGLLNTRVQTLYRDRAGTLWAGTLGGLFRLEKGRFSGLTRDNGGLSSFEIDALCEDREGSLWVGTHDGGLNRLKDERVANYTTRQGLPEDRVWSVFEDREGSLWVGTHDGSLSRMRPDARVFEIVAQLEGPVISLAQDSDGAVWAGTRDRGAYRLLGRLLRHFTREDGLPANAISSICADRRGGVWLGSAGAGVFFYRDGKFTRYTESDGLAFNQVFAIAQDRQDAMWFGTFGGGLSRFQDGRFQTWTTKDGLAHDIVMSIYQDDLGVYWFGTRGGLSRFAGGKFVNYRQSEGLFHDAVQKVLGDDHGYLWLTSNRGIFRVRSDELEQAATKGGVLIHPVGFATGNGMRSVECNNGQHGGFRGRDGRLWFATLRGLAMADPGRIHINDVPPKVVIEAVSSGRRVFLPTGSLVLEPSVRDVELQYTALSFLNPAAIRFRYQLEGFDRAWIESGARRTAYYTNLPPGRYRFRVLACNEDGVWSREGAVSELTLSPWLSETLPFRLLCAAGVLALGLAAHRLRLKRAAARESLRAALFESRLSAMQSQMQPHFLFNALNSLLPLVGNEPGRARRMIVRIADFLRASLLSETTQRVTLDRDLALLDEYLDIERMRFRDRIRVEFDVDPKARAAQVPSFLLQPLVENAIKHGADPLTGRVVVTLTARTDADSVCLWVRDDGPGMAAGEGAAAAGIGLKNIRHRLEMLFPGRHEFYLSNLQGGGCEVFLRVPLSYPAEQNEPSGRRLSAAANR